MAVPSNPAVSQRPYAPLAVAVLASSLAVFLPARDRWMTGAGIGLLLVAFLAFLYPRRWALAFCATALLLPPLPIALGETGPHPSILIALAAVAPAAARIREWRIRLRFLDLALLAFPGAAALSLGFAAWYSGIPLALASGARLALLAAGILVYFWSSQGTGRESPRERDQTARWLFAVCALAALAGCVDFVFQLPAPSGFGAQYIWLDSGIYRRAQGLFYDASALGNFCSFFLTWSIASLVERHGRRPIPVLASAGGVLLALGALLVSYSRAPLAAAIASCGALAFLERKRWWRPRKAAGLLCVLCLAAVASAAFGWALPEFASGYWSRWSMSFDRAITSPDQVLSGRLDTWWSLGQILSEHPAEMLLGIGYKTLPFTDHFGKPIVADNMYLSTLAETGVAGLLALIAMNLALLRTGYRAAASGSFFGKLLFCFWIGETVEMLAADVLTFWRLLPLYFWIVAQSVQDLEGTRAE